ncbi:MAG: putative metal-binding motif-containing protein [Dokdonella sp.]|uniref:putative metal-binding motif-containing protein n=1 Tax=Dokdonella sp. TaxID=2291710 RepID=UPI003F7F0204
MNALRFVRSSTVALALAAAPTASAGTSEALLRPFGAVPGGGDCNDNDPSIHPGHAEIADNRRDDDCDGLADEDIDDVPSNDTGDLDGDSFSPATGDCDDTSASIHPGIAEIVGNYVDDDCDGLADEDAANHPSSDSADRDGDQVIIAPDTIFTAGFESPA